MTATIGIDPGPQLHVWVPGTPAPQGSMKAYVRGGRAHLVSDNKRTMPWREAIQNVLLAAGHGRELIDGPVRIEMEFWMPRLKGHYGKKGLLKSAPEFPATKPDIDKLVRAVLDALTGVALWDDSRVVSLTARKQWALAQHEEGVAIRICPLAPYKGAVPWSQAPRRGPDGTRITAAHRGEEQA